MVDVGYDDFFKKGWNFTKKFDPLTTRALELGSKYASKGVGEIGHAIGWDALEREADKNTDDPARGIGRAALATALVYGGGALLGAGAGGSGAAAAVPEATSGAAGLGGMAGEAAGAGIAADGVTAAGSSSPAWMNYVKNGMRLQNMLGGQGGGQQSNQNMMRQMMLAELMRQNAAYSAQNQKESGNVGPTYP